MPGRFAELARFNADRGRGLVHDTATVERMRALQADYDRWQREQIYARARAAGDEVVEHDGGRLLMVCRRRRSWWR